jgi:cellulose biosynthesis protein BcsQ
MSAPVLTFFNNKGGVGKTSLVYHLSWMFTELGHRVLAADLDPQANLTSAFLNEDQLEEIWENQPDQPNTLYRCLKPLLGVGDIRDPVLQRVAPELALLPGDLALSGIEDALSEEWPKSMGDDNLFRPYRVITAFWHILQRAAQAHEADLLLIDVGPNLGAINRSALIASTHVVIPLGADLFSLQGLRNLGPTLRSWRALWQKRIENWPQPEFDLPAGTMRPVGYVPQQHGVRLSRPIQAYDRWLNRIPAEYRRSVLHDLQSPAPPIVQDPCCLAMLKHYHSLVPLAQEARRPIFALRVADGAIGAHASAVQMAYRDFQRLAQRILVEMPLAPAPPSTTQQAELLLREQPAPWPKTSP